MKTLYMLLLTLVSHLAIAQTPFITRWNLATAGSGATQLTFGVATSGTVSYTWQEVSPGTGSGSGTFTGNTATITSLPSGAVIDLSISPANFNRFIIDEGTDKNRLADVRQWGTTSWTSMAKAFYGSANLQISATDYPDLTGLTSMAGMFTSCTVLNGPANISEWNTAHVTDMNALFDNARAFNQPLGTWETGEVTNMSNMFFQARAFNQPIGNWNIAKVTNMSGMFNAAIVFNQPIGNWNTANVTNMSGMFAAAVVFDQPIGAWNTVNVTNMGTMFRQALAFNQPIDHWNTTQVTDMSNMFSGASFFNNYLGDWVLNATVDLTNMFLNSGLDCYYYSATLIGWSANSATPGGRSLGAGGRSFGTNAGAARNNLVTTKGWTITGDAASGSDCSETPYFVTRWNLATSGSGDTQLTFGVGTSGPGSYTWQEVSPGTASGYGSFTGSTATITGLPVGAIIDLSISPANFNRFIINYGADKDRLTGIRKWGATTWTSMQDAFSGCSYLQISATDLPNLNIVTSLDNMFSGCAILNGPSNIGSWDTGNVRLMSRMFQNASAFNQPIGTWNTVKVTNMYGMFWGASAFNQPIANWHTEHVADMQYMFISAVAFNQPIGTWDTGNVTNMYGMFYEASAFNQPIANWNTEKVTTMYLMFSNAIAFNQPIGNWNTTNVTSMVSMFNKASAFNQPIGNWNTTNVTSMASMFNKASAFNQPIGNWNTTNVTSMSLMFSNATSFNRSLGAWTLNPEVNLTDMLNGSGLDCYYYSTTLNGWSANTSTPSGRSLGAGGRSYGTNAAAAHSNLITTKGWTITDDAASGSDCSTPLPVTLVSFSGKKTAENQNTLKWITADEKDFDRFEVQRSSDARSFETIGVVVEQRMDGHALTTYEFTDFLPGTSNYYRLKMVDRAANGVDGSFQYSRIISIENSAEQAVVGSFYPNPSNGKVFVDVYALESGSWTLTLTDAAGRAIDTQVHHLKMGINKIALSRLKPGVNLVCFEHGQISEVRKLISE